jgi:hypothetical protein
MATSVPPIRAMMEALHGHYQVLWINGLAPVYGQPTSIGSYLTALELASFIVCDHGLHTSCKSNRRVARVNCFQFLIWAAVLAYLKEYLPKQPSERMAYFGKWLGSPLELAIRAAFQPSTNLDHQRTALQTLFMRFHRAGSTTLDLFDHGIRQLRLAQHKPIIVPHAFSMDSVLIFEAYDVPAGQAETKKLSDLLGTSTPPVLSRPIHGVVVYNPVDADALSSTGLGLLGPAFAPAPLKGHMLWGTDSNEQIVGRFTELHMSPADMWREQNAA